MIKPIKIIRSNRKSIALVITLDAQLVVRAPLAATDKYIESILQQKADWINKKLEHVKNLNKVHPVKSYDDGETFLFLGRKLKLKADKNTVVVCENNGLLLVPKGSTENPQFLVEKWYKENGLKIITERVKVLAETHGFKYKSAAISNAKRRWGSCGPKNTLNFSWRLIMAPVYVIDYVIIHELVHTRVKNHSLQFWLGVKILCPNYNKAKLWLKKNQGLMDV